MRRDTYKYIYLFPFDHFSVLFYFVLRRNGDRVRLGSSTFNGLREKCRKERLVFELDFILQTHYDF